ncbi:MAG: 2-hydroxyacyl-CoA dehydratase [Candidatus Lindowbacteria bacterium]|nr:2-hydroxyacyl-CoA dehydratase [Candidatus Lindowbacteria bacterium]
MADRRSPKIQAGGRMKEMMSAYYLEAKNAADNNRKVAWITSGGPVELLIAADVIPVYPENHGAMCGVTRMGVELCEVAENMGYSRDLCSYARTDIGSAVTGKSPIMGLPRPDFLLCCNNICGTVTKWYEVLSRLFNVPLVYIDTPFIHEELTENSVQYVKEQLGRAISQIESVIGKRFDMDRFTEVVVRSGQAARLWGETLATCKNIPSPMSAFDGFILMGPIVTLRGTQEVIDYYEALRAELEDRVANGVAAVPGERHRLLWDNLPIWFKMRDLSEKFLDLQACIVASTYLNAWARYELDATDPIDGIARAYASAFVNESIQHRAQLMRKIVEEYSVDGVIFHSNRSCRPYSLGQYDIKEMLTEWTGAPGILIEADMNDERTYSEGPVFTRLEAFIETLKPRRAVSV